MGKGAGGCDHRQSLSLTDNGLPARLQSILDEQSPSALWEMLPLSASYTETVTILHTLRMLQRRKNPDEREEKISLGNKQAWIDAQLMGAQSVIPDEVGATLLGREWKTRLLEDYADKHCEEYQQLGEKALQLLQEAQQWRKIENWLEYDRNSPPHDCNEEFIAMLNSLGPSADHSFKIDFAKDQILELQEQAQKASRRRRMKLNERYGLIGMDGNYSPGEVDLTDTLAQRLQSTPGYEDAVEAAYQRYEHFFETYWQEKEYLQSITRRDIIDQPRWRMQDLQVIDDACASDGKQRPLVFQHSILQDGLAYQQYCSTRTQVEMDKYQLSDLFTATTKLPIELLGKPTVTGQTRLDWEDMNDTLFDKLDTYQTPAGSDPVPALQTACAECSPFFAQLDPRQQAAIAGYIHGNWEKRHTNRLEWITGPVQPQTCAQIERDKEDIIIQQMLHAGAVQGEHRIELPTYQSSHQIDPARSLVLQRGAATVTYVPHQNVATHRGTVYDHTVTYEIDDWVKRKAISRLVIDLDDVALSEQSVVARMHLDGRKTIVSVHDLWEQGMISRTDRSTIIYRGENTDNTVLCEDRDGCQIVGITPDDSLLDSPYRRVKNRIVPLADARKIRRQIQKIQTAPTTMSFTVRSDNEDEQTGLFGPGMLLETEVGDPYTYIAKQARDQGLPEALAYAIAKNEDKGVITKTTPRQDRIHWPQTGPLSERGRLIITGADTAQAAAIITELDNKSKLETHIPDGWLYPGQTHPSLPSGKVLPADPELFVGKQTLRTPSGKMVLHGMTGIDGDSNQAVERLTNIINAGGLTSIADRRRGNIQVSSMSPLGDIASGIDTGVPCALLDRPGYGNTIFFGLRPEVLHRRDLWFSDQDFGGGHNRYEEYTQYAQGIGQGRIFHSPSAQSRQRHFSTGGADAPTNEVYLKDAVPLADIDTIWVQSDDNELYVKIRTQIHQARQDGIIPTDTRVLPASFTDKGCLGEKLTEQIKQRALELAKTPH